MPPAPAMIPPAIEAIAASERVMPVKLSGQPESIAMPTKVLMTDIASVIDRSSREGRITADTAMDMADALVVTVGEKSSVAVKVAAPNQNE